jgi:hypothetical protein
LAAAVASSSSSSFFLDGELQLVPLVEAVLLGHRGLCLRLRVRDDGREAR